MTLYRLKLQFTHCLSTQERRSPLAFGEYPSDASLSPPRGRDSVYGPWPQTGRKHKKYSAKFRPAGAESSSQESDSDIESLGIWHSRPPYEHLEPEEEEQQHTPKSSVARELSRVECMTHDVACYMQVRARSGTFIATMYSEALIHPGMYGFCQHDPKSSFYRLVMENHPSNPMWYDIATFTKPADAVDDEYEVLQVGTQFSPNVLLGIGSMYQKPEAGLYRMGPLYPRKKGEKPERLPWFWVTVVLENDDEKKDSASA